MPIYTSIEQAEIILLPRELNNIEETLVKKLKEETNQSGKLGFVFEISNVRPISNRILHALSGEVLYRVSYQVVGLMPEVGDIFEDAIVIAAYPAGIICKVQNCLDTLIPQQKLDEKGWQYQPPFYKNSQSGDILGPNSSVKVELTAVRIDNKGFRAAIADLRS